MPAPATGCWRLHGETGVAEIALHLLSVRSAECQEEWMQRSGRQLGALVKAGRSDTCVASVGSLLSVLSIGSVASFASILSIGSAGSVLSIGSSGSILSIGSVGSILSIGSAGAILRIGGAGGKARPSRRAE